MKCCPECHREYDDVYDICSVCGAKLMPATSTGQTHSSARPEVNSTSSGVPFEQHRGAITIVNGMVIGSNTQQYYQSKFTKLFNALFSGEPYQLGHTTFTTILRVRDNSLNVLPDNARDITVYGNMQSILAPGDNITVEAIHRGNRYIARRIVNHSTNSEVHIQPYISSALIRMIACAILVMIIILIHSVTTVDYTSVGNSISSWVSSIIPAVLIIAVIVYLLKSIIKPK